MSNTYRQAGATKKEAKNNRLRIELEHDSKFKEMLNFDPIGATFNEINPNEDSCIFEETLESNLKKQVLVKLRSIASCMAKNYKNKTSNIYQIQN